MENPIRMDDLGVPYFWNHPMVATQIFLFSPRSLGKWSNLTSIFFRWVGSTTNQFQSCDLVILTFVDTSTWVLDKVFSNFYCNVIVLHDPWPIRNGSFMNPFSKSVDSVGPHNPNGWLVSCCNMNAQEVVVRFSPNGFRIVSNWGNRVSNALAPQQIGGLWLRLSDGKFVEDSVFASAIWARAAVVSKAFVLFIFFAYFERCSSCTAQN